MTITINKKLTAGAFITIISLIVIAITSIHGMETMESGSRADVLSHEILLLVLTCTTILISIVMNWWIFKSVTRPIKEVIRVTKSVANGDLTDKAQVYNDDELGELSSGVNELTDKLRHILKEISLDSQQLSSAAEQTSVISEKSNESIMQQKEQTGMIATAMTQMSSTVDEVAKRANSTLSEVKKANKETLDGKAVVQNSINTINTLATELDEACKVIDKLDEYSTNIGAVLDVIRGIADQTNLLALNAAIEAARAGEQGRGFAVVADEVRTLASKTQESTSEIQEMIERLQSGTREAVEVMQESREEAKNSVEKTALAGESLSQITKAVNTINDMSSHIASAAEEQSSVSVEMSRNINRISDMADQTSQGASEHNAASKELAKLAVNLQTLVNQFKL
jgi:methyl-accepting chemotaxis protein